MRILLTLASLFWAFLLFMTGARFLILLFNADKTNQIIDWILRHSDFWVKPFFNLIENKGVSSTGGFIEPASLIAFAVYLIVGSIVLSILRGAFAGSFGGFGGRLFRHA